MMNALGRDSLAGEIYHTAHLTGSFRLRSGATSTEYFDKYRFASQPRLLREIARHLANSIPSDTTTLAGLELGGIPLATMLSQLTGLPALFVRKQAKTYGTCRYAEGGEVAGRKLLVVEDVVTSGGQIIESVRALRNDGAIITHALCVIDREAGGTEALRSESVALLPLFTMSRLKAVSERVDAPQDAPRT